MIRYLPLMPNVWLEEKTGYSLFVNEKNEFTMMFQGYMDNNAGLPIQSENVDRAARGFFFQDQTYGTLLLDGFVVYFSSSD